ncbi:DUF58 domain-containing protein [Leucothrix pacifica]|uniref:DUF58 domain-containing protein n=2 Tax=Leucothrix pacifica TaxID=1247513 RepID=A0A317CPA1_9GAMM|nr:DUF58 domain-containing protein [Leucothrix pacifica]
MTLPIPGTSLYKLLAALTLLALLGSFWSPMILVWQVASGCAMILVLLDLFLLYQRGIPEINREYQNSIPLGVKRTISLIVINHSKYPCTFDLYDHYPLELEAQGLPVHLSLPADGNAKIQYQVTAKARGKYEFIGVQLHLWSRWRFWQRDYRMSLAGEIHVYPNFAAIPHIALLATDNFLSQMGIIKKPRRGQGQDFHQLREYREGDSMRQIDWKATSRIRKVISREYQDERDQEIIFLLDCGHRMRARDAGLSHFDHTLNALLMLSYVALRQGDAVGLNTFGGSSRWASPKKGHHTIQSLLNTVYDLQPGTAAPDYTQAASDLLVRHKKRSLVIILSNIRDEDNAELQAAVGLLKRRHLVLVASLREKALDQNLQDAPIDMTEALRTSAIHHYLQERKAAFDRLSNQGVIAVDVEPQQLGVSLINSYLGIKASGKL